MAPERPPELEMLPYVPEENEEEEQSESKGNGDVRDSSDSDGEDGEETNDRCGIKWEGNDSFFEWEDVRLVKPLGMTESAMRACARRMDPAEKERLLRTHEEIRLMKGKVLAARRRLEADTMEVVMYETDRRMEG